MALQFLSANRRTCKLTYIHYNTQTKMPGGRHYVPVDTRGWNANWVGFPLHNSSHDSMRYKSSMWARAGKKSSHSSSNYGLLVTSQVVYTMYVCAYVYIGRQETCPESYAYYCYDYFLVIAPRMETYYSRQACKVFWLFLLLSNFFFFSPSSLCFPWDGIQSQFVPISNGYCSFQAE